MVNKGVAVAILSALERHGPTTESDLQSRVRSHTANLFFRTLHWLITNRYVEEVAQTREPERETTYAASRRERKHHWKSVILDDLFDAYTDMHFTAQMAARRFVMYEQLENEFNIVERLRDIPELEYRANPDRFRVSPQYIHSLHDQ